MPQVISWQTTPEQAREHITQALELVGEHELTPGEREALLPCIVNLLSSKPVGMQSDAPRIDLPNLMGGRH